MRRSIAAVLLLCLSGCAEPIRHQRALRVLHRQAYVQCRDHSRCREVEPCSRGLVSAIRLWQDAGEAIADAKDTTVPVADALISEGETRRTCVVVGIK